MIALSVREPWAWLIIHGGKDIENRNWNTARRGRFLVHASQGMTRREYDSTVRFLTDLGKDEVLARMPTFENMPRGGVIGSVELVDVVRDCHSPWFVGSHGFVLRDPEPLPFTPFKGRLGFFDVPGVGE